MKIAALLALLLLAPRSSPWCCSSMRSCSERGDRCACNSERRARRLLRGTVVEFRWTPTIERGVYNRVIQEGVRTPPRFSVTVGEKIPTAVELYDVPSDIEYAPLRRYRYTVRDDRLYIVGPDTRKVVRIIN
jgi:Protein of unknown function (DUF1236)